MDQLEKACKSVESGLDWLMAASEVGTKTERFAALMLREELAKVYEKINGLRWAVKADTQKRGDDHE